MEDVRQTLNDILDPEGDAKKLANVMARPLLQAIEDEGEDFVWGPAISVIGLLMASPDADKEQAILSARDFGQHLVTEVQEKWDELAAIRRRFESGEFA